MRLHANWVRIAITAVVAVVLLMSRTASACVYDSDCDIDYVCCGDGSCWYLSCPSSGGCTSDADCSSGEGCCSDGSCSSSCLATSACDSTQTDCGDYCCDSSFPFCCSGSCGADSTCSACPADAPNDCGDGFCCDDLHPFCCGNGTCSSSSACTITVGGVGGSIKTSGGGGSGPKQWGCDVGAGNAAGAPWLAIVLGVGIALALVRSRRRGLRVVVAGTLLATFITFGCLSAPSDSDVPAKTKVTR